MQTKGVRRLMVTNGGFRFQAVLKPLHATHMQLQEPRLRARPKLFLGCTVALSACLPSSMRDTATESSSWLSKEVPC